MCPCVPDHMSFWRCWFSAKGKTGVRKESPMCWRRMFSPLHHPCSSFRIGQNFQNELPVERATLAKLSLNLIASTESLMGPGRKRCIIPYETNMIKAVGYAEWVYKSR